MAVEQRRGPLFHCLSQCVDWLDLYPINPQSLARYRQAFYTSRAKDDPIDSQLLEDLLRSYPERLHRYQPAPELERKLELFCQQRRKVVGLAVKLENQLRTITRAIGELAERIAQLFRQHPDHHLFESLPGAGDQLAPRLLCAFGADRSRWSRPTNSKKPAACALR